MNFGSPNVLAVRWRVIGSVGNVTAAVNEGWMGADLAMEKVRFTVCMLFLCCCCTVLCCCCTVLCSFHTVLCSFHTVLCSFHTVLCSFHTVLCSFMYRLEARSDGLTLKVYIYRRSVISNLRPRETRSTLPCQKTPVNANFASGFSIENAGITESCS